MDFKERALSFEEADRRHAELERRHEAREINNRELEDQLKELMIQDEEDRWWAKSRETGEWMYHDGNAWMPGTPPGYELLPTDEVLDRRSQHEQLEQPPPRMAASDSSPPQDQGRDVEPEQYRRKQTVALGAVAAVAAGVAWIAWNLAWLGTESWGLYRLAEWHVFFLFLVLPAFALLGSLGGLAGLHVRQATSYGRIGLAGFLIAFFGTVLLLVDPIAFLLLRDTAESLVDLLDLGVKIGAALSGGGLVLLGIATLRARVLPLWSGFSLIVGGSLLLIADVVGFPELFGFWRSLSEFGVGIALGAIWLVLGYVLWSQPGIAQQPRLRPGRA